MRAHVSEALTVERLADRAAMIVQDAEAYQALLDRVEALEGIQRGVADVKAGRTKPAQRVFDRLRRKHGIPR